MILLVLILVSLYTPPSPDNCTVYLLTGYSHGGDHEIRNEDGFIEVTVTFFIGGGRSVQR